MGIWPSVHRDKQETVSDKVEGEDNGCPQTFMYTLWHLERHVIGCQGLPWKYRYPEEEEKE